MREDEGGPLPIAYLVCQTPAQCTHYGLQTLVSPMFIHHLLQAFIYVAHNTLSKVGLTSTGSGAGHCAGANRPGNF